MDDRDYEIMRERCRLAADRWTPAQIEREEDRLSGVYDGTLEAHAVGIACEIT